MFLGKALTIVLCAFLLAGCEDDSQPYVEFVGGGFIFNYNTADAYYGFVVRVKRRIPADTILEAEFEDPADGEPLIDRITARAGQRQYRFQSPSVRGVVADRDYRVELRLLDPDSGALLASYATAYRSDLDQEILPDAPTTIAPGYRPSPESAVPPPGSGTAD